MKTQLIGNAIHYGKGFHEIMKNKIKRNRRLERKNADRSRRRNRKQK